MNIGIPGIDAVCFGYEGSLVAVDSRLQRGQQYRLEGDDWSSSAHSNATAGGHPGGDPTIRFEHPQGQSYNQPKYTTAFGMEANGYIVDSMDEPQLMFNMQSVQSCLVPPWLNL